MANEKKKNFPEDNFLSKTLSGFFIPYIHVVLFNFLLILDDHIKVSVFLEKQLNIDQTENYAKLHTPLCAICCHRAHQITAFV